MKFNGISFRSVTPKDAPFLREVYASTRQQEMSATGWSDEQIQAFITWQFTLQHKSYQENFPKARFMIIRYKGRDIGRLYRVNMGDEIRIIDIALLPAFRNQGIGTKMITDIIHEAAASGQAIRIHVEKTNPALSLYGRLGFQLIRDAGMHWLMELRPMKKGEKGTVS